MCQSCARPDSLYCCKWRKNSKSRHDLTLIGQCPMSNSSELFSYYTTICKGFKLIEPLFLEFSCTQTHTQTHSQTNRHTDNYSIVAVDKLATINKKSTEILKSAQIHA